MFDIQHASRSEIRLLDLAFIEITLLAANIQIYALVFLRQRLTDNRGTFPMSILSVFPARYVRFHRRFTAFIS